MLEIGDALTMASDDSRMLDENVEKSIDDLIGLLALLDGDALIQEAIDAKEHKGGKNAVWFLDRFLHVFPPAWARFSERSQLAPQKLRADLNAKESYLKYHVKRKKDIVVASAKDVELDDEFSASDS